MEIKEILSGLSDIYTENQDQLFQARIAKAQVEAIGVLVGALGNIETQLQRIAAATESLNETGIETWTNIKK
jgi:hypothetical protein